MDFGYSARIPVSVVPKFSQRGPGVGGAIAEGLQQLGGTVAKVAYDDARLKEQVADSDARIAEVEKRRWRANTGATLLGDYANLQVELDAELEQVRKSAAPGAPEHEARAREATDRVVGKFLEKIPDDPELQNRFRPMVANLTARHVIAERGWEQQARAKHIATSYETWQTTGSGQLYAKPSGEGFSAFIAEGEAAIELMDVDETTKAALRADLKEVATRSLFTGLIDSGQQAAVKARIEQGLFDAVLDAQGKSNWLAKVRNADRIASAEAEAAQGEARRAALEQAKQLQVRIKAAEDVSPADANDAIAAMRQAGVAESDILEFKFLTEDAEVSQSLRGYSTPQLEQRQRALQGKLDNGKATAADKRELGLIDDHLDSRTTQEAAKLSTLWKGSAEQKLEALGQAAQLPPEQRTAATAKVSVTMQLLTALPSQAQVQAVQGAEIRKDRPDDFLPEKSGRTDKPKEAVQTIAREYLGETINDIGGVSEELVEAALDIMAGARAQNGRGAGWHRGDFLAAMRGLTGGTQRRDGTWQGGIGTVGRFRVELPPKVSEQEFARAWARETFPDAQYGDGTPASPGDIKRHFRPRYYATTKDGWTQYVLQGPSGVLYSRTTGKPYLWGSR